MKFLRNLLKFTGFLLLLILLLIVSLIRPDISVERLSETFANESSRFIAVDGMNLHYRDEGPTDAPALLLLHGTFASLHTWDPWTETLTPEFRVIRVDLPGFGLTGPQPDNDYGIRATMYFLEALRRETGVVSWSVAGNSLGARYAMAWAQYYPEHTDKLVLLNGGGAPARPATPEPVTAPAPEQSAQTEQQQAADADAATTKASASASASAPPAPATTTQQPQRSSLLLDALGNPVIRKGLSILTPKFAFRHSLREVYYDPDRISEETVTQYYLLLRREGNRQAFLTRNQGPNDGADRSHLPSLPEPAPLDDIPVLIMWGEHDRWIPVQNAHRIAAAIPHAELIIYEDAGHVPMEEIPERTADDAAQFLRAL